ncbi:MAG TPA: carboxypeptidase-like regulatory domain-containing protein [Pirellulaceae bacterium]
MLSIKRSGMGLAWVAWLGCMIPARGLADESVLQATTSVAALPAVDVRMDDAGRVRGIVFDGAAAPRGGVALALKHGNKTVATTTTDPDGLFVFSLVQGGVFDVELGTARYAIRCWRPGTAPPNAVDRLWLADETTVRGQVQPSCWGIANPWVIAGITAAAIAIPLVLANERDDRDISSQ